jgi:hypothetical protein
MSTRSVNHGKHNFADHRIKLLPGGVNLSAEADSGIYAHLLIHRLNRGQRIAFQPVVDVDEGSPFLPASGNAVLDGLGPGSGRVLMGGCGLFLAVGGTTARIRMWATRVQSRLDPDVLLLGQIWRHALRKGNPRPMIARA